MTNRGRIVRSLGGGGGSSVLKKYLNHGLILCVITTALSPRSPSLAEDNFAHAVGAR